VTEGASNTRGFIALAQLVSMVVGTVHSGAFVASRPRPGIIALAACAIVIAVLTLYGIRVLEADREVATDLARRDARGARDERDLEHAVQTRTAELDEAQRILQRMWWLGQQITARAQLAAP